MRGQLPVSDGFVVPSAVRRSPPFPRRSLETSRLRGGTSDKETTMNRRRYVAWLGSALVAAGALGCNADEEPAGLVNTGGGGSGGAGHAGSAGTGGSAGSTSAGGSAGSAQVGDAGPDQSVGTDAQTEAAASDEAGDAADAGS